MNWVRSSWVLFFVGVGLGDLFTRHGGGGFFSTACSAWPQAVSLTQEHSRDCRVPFGSSSLPLHMQFCRRLESRPSLLFSIHPGLKDSFLHLIGRSNILLPNFCPKHWSSVPHLPTLEHKNREDHFKFYFLPRRKLSLGGQLAGHWESRKHGTAEWEVLHHLAARASYLLVA